MRERMLAGELYRAGDEELVALRARAQELVGQFNAGSAHALGQLLGRLGEGVVVLPTFRCDYGKQISIGDRTFVNYDCVFLDAAPITIGADCQIAPRVQLLAASHPVDPEPRREGWECGAPIIVGDNVWIGGGAIVCPGVTIGDDSVIGAGALVTKDVPAGVVAAGNPARVLRPVRPA